MQSKHVCLEVICMPEFIPFVSNDHWVAYKHVFKQLICHISCEHHIQSEPDPASVCCPELRMRSKICSKSEALLKSCIPIKFRHLFHRIMASHTVRGDGSTRKFWLAHGMLKQIALFIIDACSLIGVLPLHRSLRCAGAGTGKTTTTVARILYLTIGQVCIPPLLPLISRRRRVLPRPGISLQKGGSTAFACPSLRPPAPSLFVTSRDPVLPTALLNKTSFGGHFCVLFCVFCTAVVF